MVLGSIFGLLGVGLALVAFFQRRRAQATHALLVRTPTTPIASTPTGGVVEIQGTVVPSEQGLLVSSTDGRQVVMYQLDIYNTAGSTTLVHTTQARREFWLRDGSGVDARIVPGTCDPIVHVNRYSTGQTQPAFTSDNTLNSPMTRAIEELSRSLTGRTIELLLVEERSIAPGERVFAMGLGERSPDGTLYLRHLPEHPLMLSTSTEPQLREAQVKESIFAGKLFVAFVLMTLVSGAVFVAGVLWAVLGAT